MLNASRVFFAASLLAAPWALGGAETYLLSWLVVPLALSAVLASLAWSFPQRTQRITTPIVLAPVLLGAALGLAQAAPLSLSTEISASAGSLRSEFSPDASTRRSPISVDAAATRRQAAWVLLGATAVFLSANLFSSDRQRNALLAAIAANGAAVAALSIAQTATASGKIYWSLEKLSGGGAPVGPFPYHNQAGAYFAVCLACCAGWAMHSGASDRREPLPDSRRAVLSAFQAMIALLLVVGLLISYSRGALVAAVVAGIATAIAARRHVSARLGIAGIATAIAALAVVVWSNADRRAAERFASLGFEETLRGDGRYEIWAVAWRAAGDFWGVGAGLGGYQHLHPLFQTEPSKFRIEHVHNQYLETLIEGGLPATLLLLAAIAAAATTAAALCRSALQSRAAVGAAALAALVFQVAHGMVDFCLYLPANLLLYATVVGVASGAAGMPLPGPAGGTQPLRWASLLVLVAAAVGASLVMHKHALSDAAIQALPWNEEDATITAAKADRVVNRLRAATDRVPDDAQAWQAYGEALVLRYRVQARDALAEEFGVPKDRPQVWEATKPSNLLKAAGRFRRQADGASLRELRDQEVVATNLSEARRAYSEALRASPLLAGAQVRLLELSWLDDSPAVVGDAVQRLLRLTPVDARRLFEVGALAYLAGDPAASWEPWRRCLTADPSYGAQVVRLALVHLTAEQVLERLLPDDPESLLAIYQGWPESTRDARLTSLLLAKAIVVARETADEVAPSEKPSRNRLLGKLYMATGQPTMAAEAYAEAIKWRATETAWRSEYAMALAECGRIGDAVAEAVTCVRQKPNRRIYQRQLKQLKRQQAVAVKREAGG